MFLTFTFRKYIGRFYDSNGNSISNIGIKDLLMSLFEYWKNKKVKKSLTICFYQKENKDLTELLIETFDCLQTEDSNDNIKKFRWNMLERMKYPLWSLKYVGDSSKEVKALIDRIGVFLTGERDDQTSENKLLTDDIKKHQSDLQRLQCGNDPFKKGFENFIKLIPESDTINIQTVLDKLSEENFYYSEENDVKDTVQKLKNGPLSNLSELIKKINESNNSTDDWKNVLVKILEKYPQIADFLDNNLK